MCVLLSYNTERISIRIAVFDHVDANHGVLVDKRLRKHTRSDVENEPKENVEHRSSLGRSTGVDLFVFIQHVGHGRVNPVDYRTGLEQWRLHGIFDQSHRSGTEFRRHVNGHHEQFGKYHVHTGTVVSWIHCYGQCKGQTSLNTLLLLIHTPHAY